MGKCRLRWIAAVSKHVPHFQRLLFAVAFLIACLISAEQPKPSCSTGNGFGPWQAGFVFEQATENEISVHCLQPSAPLSPPPSPPPCPSSCGSVNLSLMDDVQTQLFSLHRRRMTADWDHCTGSGFNFKMFNRSNFSS